MMSAVPLTSYLAALFSTAWRVCIFIFLRILPSSQCKRILPPLWLLYFGAWYLTPSPKDLSSPLAPELKDSSKTSSKAHHANGTAALPAVSGPLHSSLTTVTTLLFSLPSPNRALQAINFSINVLLLMASAEFVFYPIYDSAETVAFTRIGAVYPDSVKIVIRYPSTSNLSEHHVQVYWRQKSATFEGHWQDGPVAHLRLQDDWIETVKLDGLWPHTTYEYRLRDDTGMLSIPSEPINFRTFPDPRLPVGSHFKFLVSSCMTPNFPYLPFQGRRIKGLDLLADYLWPASVGASPAPAVPVVDNATESVLSLETAATEATPTSALTVPPVHLETTPVTEFMLFLGDFIYADVPLYFGDDQDMYRLFYRRNYQSSSFRKVYERLPFIHTYDDHDIKNNYVGLGNDSQPPFMNASHAYSLYNGQANYDAIHNDTHYYDFRHGDVAFFVMDTRRYRSEPGGELSERTMLGERQLSALHDWLGKVNGTATFKFIVSSVPFTSLWQMDAQVDSWAAYAAEKAFLLDIMHTVPNVIILSGDRHEFAAIEFQGQGFAHRILELSTSPLSMFWIPLVRTLKMQSEETVLHSRRNAAGDSESLVVEEMPRERVLKYIAQGNYKFSSLEVDTRNLKHPVVHLEVVINGKPAYQLSIAGEPVHLQTSTALGTFVPQTFKDMLDKFGLLPQRWF